MNLTSWLRNLIRTNSTSSRAMKHPRRNRTTLRPSVEVLEDRLTPSTLHWIGSSAANGNLWNVSTNWSEHAIPTSGSTLIFDTTTPGFSVTSNGFSPSNNIAGLSNLTLSFNDASTAGDFVLGGNAFGLRSAAGVALTSTVSSGTTASPPPPTPLAVTINNNLILGANTTTNVNLGTLVLAGVIDDGASSFSLSNASPTGTTLSLDAANTYNGGTTLGLGTVEVNTNTSLGSGPLTFAGGTLTNKQAFLKLPNPYTVSSVSTIGGGSFFELTGNGVLNATLNLTNSGFLTLSGALSGAGGLNENGFPGHTILGGTAANTFTGATKVTSGELDLGKTAGVKAIVAPITVTGNQDSLTLNADNQLNGNSITLIGGNFNLGGHTDTITSLSGSGTVNTGTGLKITGAGTQIYTGTVAGTGSLTYAGSGALRLYGASSAFTGSLVVGPGTLLVAADFSGAPAQVGPGGTLSGTGIVKTITTTGGAVNAGTAGRLGLLTTAAGAFASSLTGSTLGVDVGSGGTSDHLVIGSGATINLTGAALNVNVLSSVSGSVFTIITSPSGGISGTFNGLANNATFTSGGHTFKIKYTTNAVTLTDLAGTANTLHWIGSSAANGNLWNVSTNWSEHLIPTSGSTLIFDTTTPGFSATSNGFSPSDNIAGLTNLTLSFNDASTVGDFVLSGNAFGLRSAAGVALTSTVSSGTTASPPPPTPLAVTINNNLILGTNTTTNVNLGTLILAGVIDDGASSFSLSNASPTGTTLSLDAANTYNGGTTLGLGTVEVNTNTSLGSGPLTFAGGTLTNKQAFLKLPNPYTVSSVSTIGGGSFFELTGNGVLNASLNLTNSGFLTLSGALSGPGGLNENGFPGSTTLGGTAANTFTGATTVISGGLTLAKTAGVKAIAGPVTVTGTFSTLTLNADNQLNGGNVTLIGGNLNLNGHTATIASVTGSGKINTGTGLKITGAGTQVFTGTVEGAGSLTYAGSGALRLYGASPAFTGGLVVGPGTLLVAADFSGAPAQVGPGGTLNGTGIVKSITTTGGTVNAGTAGRLGLLTTAAGSFASSLSGSTFGVDIVTIGTADQLVIGSGATLSLTGATLSVNVLGSVTGNVYNIITSPSGGISGTFNGLANNATFTSGGRTFKIKYTTTVVSLTDVT